MKALYRALLSLDLYPNLVFDHLVDAAQVHGLPRSLRSRSSSRRLLPIFLVALVLAFFSGQPLCGQAVSGSIFGTVTDNSGAAVPNAIVTVTDETKGDVVKTSTTGSGGYTVQKLIPDDYGLKIEAQGFKTVVSSHIHVSADTAAKLDVKLALGSVTETVTVTDETPALQTDRADVSTLLNDQLVSDLPLQNRNFTQLETLLVGAEPQFTMDIADDPQQSLYFNVDGQYFVGNEVILDGVRDQDDVLGLTIINPIPDDVVEAKITTQNYDSEFGLATSALTQVNTKSGSNKFHGSAWEFYQNNGQLARNPFSQPPTSVIPNATQNQFGGNVGGPIRRDKVFFFGGYQALRKSIATSVVTTVPTSLAKTTCMSGGACNLSDYLNALGPVTGQIYDPETQGSVPFAGNIIPADRINQNVAKLVALYPDPTVPNAVINNYSKSGAGTFTANQYDIRIDDVTSSTFHAFGRYSYFGSKNFGVPAFGQLGGPGLGQGGFAGSATGRNQSLVLGGDLAVKPQLLTTLRLGYSRYRVLTTAYDANDPNFLTSQGIPGINDGTPFNNGLVEFDVMALGSFGSGPDVNGCNCPLRQLEDNMQLVNNWTSTFNNHIVQFGTDLEYPRNLRSQGSTAIGFNNGLTSSSSGVGGLGLAALYLGDATSYAGTEYSSNRAYDSKNFQKRAFFYAEDTWHAKPNLTVRYGLRYNFIFPETVNGKGQGSLLNLSTGNLQVAGYGPYGTNMGIQNNLGFYSPTVGIEYQMTPKSVLRLGYGREYSVGAFGNTFGGSTSGNLPVSASVDVVGPNAYTPAYLLGQPHPVANFGTLNTATGNLPLPNSVTAVARNQQLRLATVDAWNLSLQQQLTPKMSFTIAYVGTKGTHTFPESVEINANQLALSANGYVHNPPSASNPSVGSIPNLPISPAGDVRRLPYYFKYGWTQTIAYDTNAFNSNYNALQATFEKQISHGLQFTASYAWQASFDYGSDYAAIDPKIEHGRSSDNRENAFVGYGTWKLPFGRNEMFASHVSTPVTYLIGGWELTTILHYASGLPYWASYQDCGADRDTGPCTPDIIGKFTHKLGQFNPVTNTQTFFTPVPEMATNGATSGPFQRPQFNQFGNLGRNSFFGPTFFSDDMTLIKEFPVKGGIAAQFRVDAFNAFNHIALNNPGNTCVDCTIASEAGQINNMATGVNPRQLQFSVKAIF